jgi:hypothetical protein
MVISALKNLSTTENDAILSEMLAAGKEYFRFSHSIYFKCTFTYVAFQIIILMMSLQAC